MDKQEEATLMSIDILRLYGPLNAKQIREKCVFRGEDYALYYLAVILDIEALRSNARIQPINDLESKKGLVDIIYRNILFDNINKS